MKHSAKYVPLIFFFFCIDRDETRLNVIANHCIAESNKTVNTLIIIIM